MKEIIVSENNKLEIKEVDIPQCSNNDVLVKVAYSGLCGSDIPRIFHHGAHSYPIRLGHEFTGHIVDIGKDVSTVNIGDKICCVPLIPNFETEESKRGYYSLGKGYSFIGSRQPGGNAEYVVMPESSCFILPDDITEIEGAFFEPVTVGIHPILMAGGCKDKNVVIVGVGTIGMLAMQSAKALGAKTVTAIDISDEKLALAKELGADYVINSSKEKENQEIEFLEIIKFDQLILETAGVPQTFKLSLELAGPRAQLALVGTLHKDLLLGYKEYEQILRKELTIIGSWMNYSKPFPGDEWEVTINLFRNKKIVINPLIEEVVNSDKYIKKVIGLNGYPANGKILLKWD